MKQLTKTLFLILFCISCSCLAQVKFKHRNGVQIQNTDLYEASDSLVTIKPDGTITHRPISTLPSSGGGSSLLSTIANPLDPYFGTRLQPLNSISGFYNLSNVNGATGYISNNTSTGNGVLSEFRAITNNDAFSNNLGAGISITAFGSNYFQTWLQNKTAIFGGNTDMLFMLPTNQSDFIFYMGNTATNTANQADQDEVFRLNKDKSVVFPSLTPASITAEPSGRTPITREYFESNVSPSNIQVTQKILINPLIDVSTITQTESFTRVDNADNTLNTNRDLIVPGYLEITRGNTGGAIFNYATEASWNSSISPEYTTWQEATLLDFDPNSFVTINTIMANNFINIPGKTFVVKVANDGGANLAEDQIFEITFNTWSSGNSGGGLSYTRTTLYPFNSVLTSTGCVVKQFNDTGTEILSERKFYKDDVEIIEPVSWSIIDLIEYVNKTELSNYALNSSLATVAFNGQYGSLLNIPADPTLIDINIGTTGQSNIGIGNNVFDALQSSGSSDNIGVGQAALASLVSGTDNIALGRGSLVALTNNMRNIAIGKDAAFSVTGRDNTAVGYNALRNTTTGSYNTAIGTTALNENLTGGDNVAIGLNSGNNSVSNASSIYIGPNTNSLNGSGFSEIVIGASTVGHGANTITFGGPTILETYLTGKLINESYGSGTHTGTATFNLQVDAAGNIIESALGSGGTNTNIFTSDGIITNTDRSLEYDANSTLTIADTNSDIELFFEQGNAVLNDEVGSGYNLVNNDEFTLTALNTFRLVTGTTGTPTPTIIGQVLTATDINGLADWQTPSVAWGNVTGSITNQTDLQNELVAKQDNLVSTVNIKTINNESLLGPGNLNLASGGTINLSGATASDFLYGRDVETDFTSFATLFNGATSITNGFVIPVGQTGDNTYLRVYPDWSNIVYTDLDGRNIKVIAKIETTDYPDTLISGFQFGGISGITVSNGTSSYDPSSGILTASVELICDSNYTIDTQGWWLWFDTTGAMTTEARFELKEVAVDIVETTNEIDIIGLERYKTQKQIDKSIDDRINTEEVTIITFDSDPTGSADFNGNQAIANALNSINDATKTKKYLLRGTGHFIADDISDFTMVDPLGINSFISGKNYVNIENSGLYGDLVIEGSLPDNLGGSFSYQSYQTVDWNCTAELIGAILIGKNLRYTVHVDSTGEIGTNITSILKNCHVIHNGNFNDATNWASPHAFGYGTRSNNTINIIDTIIETKSLSGIGFSCHNPNGPVDRNAYINLIRCEFRTASTPVQFTSFSGNTNTYINIQDPIYSGSTKFRLQSAYIAGKNSADYSGINLRTNAPMLFENDITQGLGLRVVSTTTGTSSTVSFDETSTAFNDIVGFSDQTPEFDNRYFYTQRYGYMWQLGNIGSSGTAIGLKDIDENATPISRSMGLSLGDCSVVNKTLTIIVDGISYNVVFNTDLTNSTNVDVLTIINGVLGSNATADTFIVGQLFYPETTYSKVLENGGTNFIPAGSPIVKITRNTFRIAGAADAYINGFTLYDCPVGSKTRILNTGAELFTGNSGEVFKTRQESVSTAPIGTVFGISNTNDGVLDRTAVSTKFARCVDTNVVKLIN